MRGITKAFEGELPVVVRRVSGHHLKLVARYKRIDWTGYSLSVLAMSMLYLLNEMYILGGFVAQKESNNVDEKSGHDEF